MINFNQNDNTVDVYNNDDRIGYLEFDQEQEVWVFWPNDINDGITYFEDLKETEDTIAEEQEA